MEADAKTWLQDRAEGFLARVGLEPGQTVLDFGCHEGNYTLPAARLVGNQGQVYALDKNRDAIKALRKEVKKDGLRNVRLVRVKEDQDLPLGASSVEVVLLYDILHGGYFPESAQRRAVLRRLYAALKPAGLLSCYPTHLARYHLTFREVLSEITDAGFRLRDKHRRRLVHDGKLVRGMVFSFLRPSAGASSSPERRTEPPVERSGRWEHRPTCS